MVEPALVIEALEYRYPGAVTNALDGIDLRLEPGELAVLAGRSGSGKSTLLRAACGLVPHFHGGEVAGAVTVGGRSTRDAGPAELARSVGFVAQEPETQVVSTTVRAELELPLELRGAGPVEIARAVEETALALAIEPLLGRTTDSLSGGELQRVALGAALVTGPPLLLLDEPTSQLDPVAGDELIALLRRLNEEWGVTVLLGEHRLERCLAAADRVVAIDRGRLLYDGPPEAFGRAALGAAPELATPVTRLFQLAGIDASPVTVKEARARLRAGAGPAPAPVPRPAETQRPSRRASGSALSCRRLRVELRGEAGPRAVLRGLDLDVDPGERVALMGPNGAGKTTLLRTAAGVLAAAGGSIAVPDGAAMLGQRPDDYFVRERVDEELPGSAGRAALAAVGLDVPGSADPRDLSGGERQRLALAIAMAGRGAGGEPSGLVCLDEPTRGLDRARKDDLAGWIAELAGRGAGLLVATHDVEFAARFASRVVLLARGRAIADGSPLEVLGGGWYFATETARVTGGRAITPEQGAGLLAPDVLAREGR
ncbi:MAG: ATP-binding cassette domain-containing protein [Solirubrobacterales bacterium]